MTDPIKIISKKEFEKQNEKPNQEIVWDSISAPWKTYVVKELPIVVNFLKDKRGLIVDLGCGNGRNMIKQKGVEYWGVDFSAGQLTHAERNLKKEKVKFQLFKSKLDKLPSDFKDEMFDAGLFVATLHCIETKKEREDSLKEFYRILKTGSEGLISVWNSEDERFNGIKGDIYMSWKEDGIPYMRYYYLYKKDELIKLLKKVGFEILEIYSPIEKDRFSKKNLVLRVRKGVFNGKEN